MNNNIKLLVEKLFNDNELDNLFGDQEQEYNDIVVNNFLIKTKGELYDYIVKEYKLKSIDDCKNISTCPETIDLTGIIVPQDFDTTELFTYFACKVIDISNWKIKTLGEGMFFCCHNLKEIVIPNSVTRIGDGVFAECSILMNITIPEGVTSIGIQAFCFCDKLKSITIPSSITSLGDNVFSECNLLRMIKTPYENKDNLKTLLPKYLHRYIIEI